MVQVERFYRIRSAIGAFVLVAAVLAGLPHAAGATEFTVTSSFPRVFPSQPDDVTLEGSVTVTATADGPATPLEPYAWLEEAGPQSWSTVFRWYETGLRIARFVGADQDTVSVNFAPAPAMPLDFARHDLPVLRITTDPASLWDPETGIYAWGNYQNFTRRGDLWERAATLEYFEADGTPVFDEAVGLRINGQSSRAYRQKGLRIYFDDYGFTDDVVHDFFGDGPVRCERLVLRAAIYSQFAIGSGMVEPLHRDLGNPGSRWSYVAVYVNDEYWGAYALRERFDSKWVETTHEWADDDYVVIKDHDAEAGDYGRWESFLSDLQVGDPTSHAWFQWLDSQLDIRSYLDWVLVNASCYTSDNMHGKNMAIVKIGGDRFQFMSWDQDLVYNGVNRDTDHFSFYASANDDEFNADIPPLWYSGGPWEFTFAWNAILWRSMQNAEFKAVLRARAAELLAGSLSVADLNARLDTLSAIQAPEWLHHDVRWDAPMSYTTWAGIVRASFSYRHAKMGLLVDGFLDTWAEQVELTGFSLVAAPDQVALSWHTERELDCEGWIVERSLDSPGAFTTIASYVDTPELVGQGDSGTPADYQFVDTTAPEGHDLYYRLTHVNSLGGARVHDWVETTEAGPEFDLRLNEVLASNTTTNFDEAGEFDDWVEIHNAGNEPVDMAGLFLSDNLGEPTKWAFPAGILQPGAFLLVWCDEDLDQGPLHASFKLSAGGEELGIYAGFAAGNAPIDTLVFGAQTTDVSLGRMPDGDGAWTLFSHPTPGASNQPTTGAPAPQTITTVKLAPAWPNPAAGALTVSGRVPEGIGPARVRVYSVRGELVRELQSGSPDGPWREWVWDGRDEGGRQVPAGVYLLRLHAGGQTSQQRVVLVR